MSYRFVTTSWTQVLAAREAPSSESRQALESLCKAYRYPLYAFVLSSEKARELLRQEVRSAREVVSPNVCRIFDLVVEDDRELVSMEFIDGVTLAETLRDRGPLEFHHDGPFGGGGDHDPSRVRLLCKVHNLLLAERDYGKDVIESYRRKSNRVSEPAPLYFVPRAPFHLSKVP